MELVLTLILLMVGLVVVVVLAAPVLVILKAWFAYWEKRLRMGDRFKF